jgi:hypothetical protein
MEIADEQHEKGQVACYSDAIVDAQYKSLSPEF